MDAAQARSQKHLLVAAIDFGTTFSGWAYQFNTEYERDRTKVFAKNWNNGSNISSKAPTTVLIKPDGKTLEAFGYKAEDKYVTLAEKEEHKNWHYFRHFKMKLFQAETITLDMKIEAANGKKLSALMIFSLVVKCLKEDLMEECKKTMVGRLDDSDVLWVLTVPAIWNDGAKHFMRKVAEKAGILSDKLVIALEPEAASVYCKQASLDKQSGLQGASMDTFSPGTKYLILDAGGGTIDINVHEVLADNHIRELYKPTGSNWGGTKVDEAFLDLFGQIFGESVMEKFKKDNMEDYLTLFRNFEVKKREVSLKNDSQITFFLSSSLVDLCQENTGQRVAERLSKSRFADSVTLAKGNKLRIGASVMQSLYKNSIQDIISQLKSILKEKNVKGCKTILMVGGYSDAELLREEIRQRFPQMNTVTPGESSLIVLKGAVLYGRNPQVITSRVCKYTYGISMRMPYDPKIHPKNRMYEEYDGLKAIKSGFDKFVEVGQDIKLYQPCIGQTCYPTAKGGTHFTLKLYATLDRNPKFIDEPGCFRVGEFEVDCRDKDGNVSGATPQLLFGGTEIEVRVVNKISKEETIRTIFRLPD